MGSVYLTQPSQNTPFTFNVHMEWIAENVMHQSHNAMWHGDNSQELYIRGTRLHSYCFLFILIFKKNQTLMLLNSEYLVISFVKKTAAKTKTIIFLLGEASDQLTLVVYVYFCVPERERKKETK